MYQEWEEKKLRFTDWKVFIDNTSDWFEKISKMYAQCYSETRYISIIYSEIRAFVTSRRANLSNYDEINDSIIKIRDIIYSVQYKEAQQDKSSQKYDTVLLKHLDNILGLISIGLSDGELIPKFNKKPELPYDLKGDHMDNINKALYETNQTTAK